jgi:hypothetical protein
MGTGLAIVIVEYVLRGKMQKDKIFCIRVRFCPVLDVILLDESQRFPMHTNTAYSHSRGLKNARQLTIDFRKQHWSTARKVLCTNH